MKAGTLLISASAKLADKLKADSCITNSNKKVTIETPIGNLDFGTTNDDTYNSPDALLLMDSGGNDNYLGKVYTAGNWLIQIEFLQESGVRCRFERWKIKFLRM